MEPLPSPPVAAGPVPASRVPREEWLRVFLLALASWLLAQAAGQVAEGFLPKGPGYPDYPGTGWLTLHRFDAVFYADLAQHGYAYNGDPRSSPNIVFPPLYPLLARWLAALTPLGPLGALYLLSHAAFAGGLALLYRTLRAWYGARCAWWGLAGLAFAPGAFAWHSAYSESLFLLLLAWALDALRRGRHWEVALASAALGASRTVAFPVCLVLGLWQLWLGWQAWRGSQPGARPWGRVLSQGLAFGVCGSGAALYLAWLAWKFGNPLVLLPQIQQASWGAFHRPMAWWEFISFAPLGQYALAAFSRPGLALADIRTVNLICFVLGLAGSLWALWRLRPWPVALSFVAYFLFIWSAKGGTEHLNSGHRLLAVMLPIPLLAAALHQRWTATWPPLAAKLLAWALLILTAFTAFLQTARFAAGHWFHF